MVTVRPGKHVSRGGNIVTTRSLTFNEFQQHNYNQHTSRSFSMILSVTISPDNFSNLTVSFKHIAFARFGTRNTGQKAKHFR
jgi:hypothetical protein